MADRPRQARRTTSERMTTISMRMQVVMALSAAVVFTVVAVIVGLGVTDYARTLATVEAKSRLESLRARLDLEASALETIATGLAASESVRVSTVSTGSYGPSPAFREWLSLQPDDRMVVWVAEDGTISLARADSADAEVMASLAASGTTARHGLIALPSGPAAIALAPVGDATPAATVVVAEPLQTGEILSSDLTTTLIGPDGASNTDERWSRITFPEGYSAAIADARDNLFLIQATLNGIDGRPAATVRLEQPDPGLARGRLWLVVIVPVALGTVTVGLAFLLGMALGRSITAPIHRFVTYLQEQGYLALHGLRTDETVIVEPGIPGDFAELGEVITDLMKQLRVNQAELLEANEQALAAERAFRTVVEESPELKILVREGVVEIANPAAAHFFGLHMGDLLRADPDGLFAGVRFFNEAGDSVDFLEIAQESDGGARVVRCLVDDQPERWMEMNVAFIDPEERDYVISARNVTEERRLEALREEVMSLASHDLRSPLTVVRGYLDILDKPIGDEQRGKAVAAARRATERLEGLLNDLLDATRAERVLAPQVMRPVDLGELARSVASSLQIGTLQTIVVDTAEPVTVLGDRDRLEQAITNLVGNAIKHGPAEGEIRVGVSSRDGHALVTVEDDGPGIPTNQRESLFERGMRGSKDMPGMGLGLYIVRVVSEAHGGTAYVEATPRGTQFVISLPLTASDSTPG